MSLHPMANGFEPEEEIAAAKKTGDDGIDYLYLFRFREDNSMINWFQIPWDDFIKHQWTTVFLDKHDAETHQIYQDYKNFRVLLGIPYLPFDGWYAEQPMMLQFMDANGKKWSYRMTFRGYLTAERVLQRMIANPDRYITQQQAVLNTQEAPHTVTDEEVKQDFRIA